MTASQTRQLHTNDREDTAARLLRSSVKLSFDPQTEIDWDAPLDRDHYSMSPELISLYGTPLWDSLTEEQRRELSRQEMASICSISIWAETILMQMLVRRAYDGDPASNHIQYAYTEIADECRHSVMFARFIGKLGAPCYQPDLLARFFGRVLKTVSNGPLTYSGALFVEELGDRLQREVISDDRLEPLTRAVSRIHVTEEARHMRYAREELIRVWSRHTVLSRGLNRFLLALSAYIVATRLIHPECYAKVGLNPRQARRAAKRSQVRRDRTIWLVHKAVETFTAAGLMGGPGTYLWRKAGLL